MKLCSFVHQDSAGFGFEDGDGEIVDLGVAASALLGVGKLGDADQEVLKAPDLKSWISRGELGLETAGRIRDLLDQDPGLREQATRSRSQLELLAPIPNPAKIIAIGLNYQDHADEQLVNLPEVPLIFAKFPNTLIGNGAAIQLPEISRKVDPEAELCIVISTGGRGLSEQEAPQAIAGYTIGNDVSARDLQRSDRQWVRGKSCDTFAPCGPFLVTSDEIGDPHQLDIELRLNGDVQQSSNTRHLIFDCYRLVSFISEAISLEAGDLIFTGTPSGVGVYRDPPIFLKNGDLVEISVQGIGTLSNPVQ